MISHDNCGELSALHILLFWLLIYPPAWNRASSIKKTLSMVKCVYPYALL